MPLLTPAAKKALGSLASSITKYFVERGNDLSTIVSKLREKGYNLAFRTVNSLVNYWLGAQTAAQKLQGEGINKPVSQANIPQSATSTGMVRIGYEVDTILPDQEDRTFYSLYIDVDESLTPQDITKLMANKFMSELGNQYEAKMVLIRFTTAEKI